jgi:hypothetical protein
MLTGEMTAHEQRRFSAGISSLIAEFALLGQQ